MSHSDSIQALNHFSNNTASFSVEELEFESILKDSQNIINQAEYELKNGDLVIKEHYSQIKHKINLAKEYRIQEINKQYDDLMDKTNKSEKESFAGHLKLNKDEFQKKLNEFKNSIEIESKKERNLKKNLEDLKEIHSKIMIQQEKLKRFNFNDEMLDYRENKCKISRNKLGRLVPHVFEYVKLENFERIDYGKYLNAMLREDYSNYPNQIEEIINIDIEGTGFLANGCFILLSIFYDNCDDTINHLNIFQFDESRQLKNFKRIEDVNLDETNFRIVSNKICLNFKDFMDHKYYLKILDEDLLTLVTVEIENKTLIGADENYIYCLSDDENDPSPLHFYSWSLELVYRIGQKTDSEKPFYFPKFCSQIFSFTSNNRKYYVLYIVDYIHIMDASTGQLIRTVEKYAHKIEVDSKNNIITFNRRGFTYFNSNGYFIKEVHAIDFPKNTGFYWSLDKNDRLYFFDPEKFYLSI